MSRYFHFKWSNQLKRYRYYPLSFHDHVTGLISQQLAKQNSLQLKASDFTLEGACE